jgi:hypothetical protein
LSSATRESVGTPTPTLLPSADTWPPKQAELGMKYALKSAKAAVVSHKQSPSERPVQLPPDFGYPTAGRIEKRALERRAGIFDQRRTVACGS